MRALIRKGLTLAGIVLVAFHVWLFGRQAWDGQLVELALVARWLVAGGLAAALLSRWRRGLSVVWGRQAVAVWLLAALLHGPAVARDLAGESPALPEVAATITQTVLAIGVLAVLLLTGLAALSRRPAAPLRRLALVTEPSVHRAFLAGALLHVAPRPPPLV